MLCIKHFTWIEVEPILSPRHLLFIRQQGSLSLTSGLSETLATSAVSILAVSLA